jgi:hypothetical protein
MSKSRVNIPESELKILFARSGNLCAFPGCQTQIIAQEGDELKPIAEMAHMIAYGDSGPRADPRLSLEERNRATNLILLCPTHHVIIDKFEYQYNVQVLRQMKLLHEQKIARSLQQETLDSRERKTTSESLYASFLPVLHLPEFVFSAETPYRRDNIQDLFEYLKANESRDILYAFELREKKIFTFFDLRESTNPFWGAYNGSTITVAKATDLWAELDAHRLYVALLNRALNSFLRTKWVIYDPNHHRYFFKADKEKIERKFSYKALSGKKTTKAVVHQPTTRATGLPKSYWIHLAANLSFQQIAPQQWVLTIRPERHITKDGYEPYLHTSIGSKVTRIKSRMYNWEYLQEIQLWREFITEARPRLVLRFGKQEQAIIIENTLPEGTIEWVGAPDDRKDFVAQKHPEDLFSFAEISFLNEETEDTEDSIYLDEYEE